jgi:transcriptional regulator with XRE-family HTH domain
MTETPTTPNVALAEAIEESGLRKDFIAATVGVAPATLSRWLSGRQDPGLLHREKLAILLRCRPDVFVRPACSEGTFHTSAAVHTAAFNAAASVSDGPGRKAAA